VVAESTSNVQTLLKSSSVSPSSPIPAVAKKDVHLWIVSCGEQAIGCSIPTAAAKSAAEMLGWKATVCDGMFNTANAYNTCISQGVTAGSTAIATVGLDCAAAVSGLKEAKAAGIPTVTTAGFDCNDASVKAGEPLYSALSGWTPNAASPAEFYTAVGKAAADWIIAETNGQAHAISVSVSGITTYDYMMTGFKDRMSQCSGCKLTEVSAGLADFGNGNLKASIATKLTANPDTNAMWVVADGNVGLLEIPQALRTAGLADKVKVVGGQGTRLDLIRSRRGLDAVVAWDARWQGWGLVDSTLRILGGDTKAIMPTGAGIAIVDATHNLPADASVNVYQDAVDFQSGYKSLWKVS
ncbi:MAG: hypothetical protein JWN41_1748, partial [Thermoleophilia bacterium]|nr:hypothetical protein [Thermoleophilia bacterium]